MYFSAWILTIRYVFTTLNSILETHFQKPSKIWWPHTCFHSLLVYFILFFILLIYAFKTICHTTQVSITLSSKANNKRLTWSFHFGLPCTRTTDKCLQPRLSLVCWIPNASDYHIVCAPTRICLLKIFLLTFAISSYLKYENYFINPGLSSHSRSTIPWYIFPLK